MYWQVVEEGKPVFGFAVDGQFFEWLRGRTTDSELRQFDAYRDRTLLEPAQHRWLTSLRAVQRELRDEMRADIEHRVRLPADPDTRELVVQPMLDSGFRRHTWAGVLDDLVAALELTIGGSTAVVQILAD